MRLVSVVMITRSFLSARMRISPSRSSTWPSVGRTSTIGSSTPVGRITCSTTWPWLCSSSQLPGVALTKMVWVAFSQNSDPFKGLLSAALGRRKPCSISTCLRDWSPLYMACSWEQVTWLSSTTNSQSSGK